MEGVILDDVEEEEENTWGNQASGRNCIIFIVDARDAMFADRNGTSYFKQSILCVRHSMLEICRKQRSDLVGVLLYCSKLTEGKYAPDNVALLQELTVPSVPVIKHLNEMIEDDFEVLRAKYNNVRSADLTRAINYGQIVMHLCKMKTYLKNIVLMTYDDNPCGDDERAAFRARKQASELYLHQIELDVVSFGEFDSSKLFKELILTSRGELLKGWENKDPVLKIDGVQNQIDKLTQKFSRRLSFLRIGGDDSRYIMQISLYKIFTEPRKFITTVKNIETENGTNIKEGNNIARIESRNEEVIVKMEKDYDELFLREDFMSNIDEIEKSAVNKPGASTSGAQIVNNLPSTSHDAELNTSAQEEDRERKNKVEMNPFIGRKRLNITKTELKKRISAPVLGKRRGFQLIGFVQTDDVPLYFNLGEPYFVLPFGRDKNNRIAFSHLLQKCRERGVSMVGWFCITKSASPTLTILHPLDASTDGKGHPEGFLLTKIPYEDDLFEFDEAETAIQRKPTAQQLEAAKRIVAKLSLPYTVDMFSDCEYLTRVAMIEALAMDYEDVPSTEDNTDVDLDHITNMLGDLSDQFIGGSNDGDSSRAAGYKRAAPNVKSGAVKQRKKIDAMEAILSGQANKLTAPELRDILKDEGIRNVSAMNKSRLVNVAMRKFCKNSQ